MGNSRATLGVDLHVEPSAAGGLRRGLTDALRDAVRTGRLAAGTRLPSSRSLAADLGIARNTVAEAYADLVAEGWLTARQGSGTRVATGVATAPTGRREKAAPPRRRVSDRPAYDLKPGTPDLAAFPRAEWLKAARRALGAAPSEALGYGDPCGRPELRTALAGYLSRSRGVRADPDNILVCAGISHGLRILATVLRARGAGSVAVESYGLDVHWRILAAAGLATHPLPYDELGTDTGDLAGTDAGAVLLTPAHQFPMGTSLRPDRRAAAVDWARRTGGFVLEDDYDGEFRYDRRQPVGALQGLAPEHVVYLGTASKSLAPGLRLAWMVLPPSLARECAAAKGDSDTCGVLEQLTLAEFLTSGAYDRHVRAARLRYRRRRDALVAALAARAPEVRVTGIAAGLHAVLRLPQGSEPPVVQAAAWQGLALHGLSFYRHEQARAERPDALVVGYGTPPDHAWAGALEALCRVLP
ncbi:PLP-dependent aminotransferase family protein [Streptomyces sp. V3I7]|uniref:MocR-like pyridoxine biosynthesis transcription factor PdxR n=1 Tax=Streptomyces sp. V3I7 TaxID=3042278 RepID=UPI002789FBD5|nr:PLP-dependent aminotransferase family protein [Streptomyces sp. V3I7]MDQ0992604.1 GntR family transcriptional regulator/MocR family aminotransferase [Streptomyces sp. V3I7]